MSPVLLVLQHVSIQREERIHESGSAHSWDRTKSCAYRSYHVTEVYVLSVQAAASDSTLSSPGALSHENFRKTRRRWILKVYLESGRKGWARVSLWFRVGRFEWSCVSSPTAADNPIDNSSKDKVLSVRQSEAEDAGLVTHGAHPKRLHRHHHMGQRPLFVRLDEARNRKRDDEVRNVQID